MADNTEYEQEMYNPFIKGQQTTNNNTYNIIYNIFNNNYINLYAIANKKVKRPKTNGYCNRVRRNILMYINNLLCSDNGVIAVSRDARYLANLKSKWHTYTHAILAQDLLIYNGLVDYKKGQNSIMFDKGFASRLSINDKFKEVFKDIEKMQPELDVDEIKSVTFENCPNIMFKDEIENKVSCLNDNYFSNVQLTHPTIETPSFLRNVYLTRIFKQDGCGRFYQLYGTSYQNIPSEIRKGMLINNKKTVEMDFSSMHPNLLYNRVGSNMPYNKAYIPVMEDLGLNVFDPEYKDIIKHCIFVMINATNYKSYAVSFNDKHKGGKYYKMVESLKKHDITRKMVYDSVIKIHKGIEQYIASNASISLMLEESDIMMNILLELYSLNILSVPLHDSIICEIGQEDEVKRVMEEEYKIYTGFDVKVELK